MQAMNDQSPQNQSRESLWRRKPAATEAETAALAASPEMAEELKIESRLTGALFRLPDVPVASNFSARVMQAIDLEESQASARPHWRWRLLLPRLAIPLVAVVIAGFAWQHHEQSVNRAALARSVALLAGSPALPSVDALKNFDTIQRMSQPRADEELIALLQ